MLISGSFRGRRLKSGSGCGREAGRQRGSFRRSCPNTRVFLSSASSSTSGFRGFVDVFDDARVTSSRRGVGVGRGRSRSRSSTLNCVRFAGSRVCHVPSGPTNSRSRASDAAADAAADAATDSSASAATFQTASVSASGRPRSVVTASTGSTGSGATARRRTGSCAIS